MLQDEAVFRTVTPREGTAESKGFRLIRLNRPKALNALNLNMIKLIRGDMEVSWIESVWHSNCLIS